MAAKAVAVPITVAPDIAEVLAVFAELIQKAPESVVLAVVDVLGVAAKDEAKAPFVARALHALTRLTEVSSKSALNNAAGASSDTLVLLEALNRPEVLAALSANDPLIEARIRGALARDWLVRAEGGMCSAEDLGQLLGRISRQAIDKRRKSGKLLALKLGRHGYGYPAWQVHEGTVLNGLDRVLAELSECDPWTQVGFMLNPNSWLDGETPLAELRRGEIDRVVETASMFSA